MLVLIQINENLQNIELYGLVYTKKENSNQKEFWFLEKPKDNI